jgi:hypothetical protein
VQFDEDVVAWYRGGGPEVELRFLWIDMDDYEHQVTKYMTPSEAYALAQRLLSAVESTSRAPGSHPIVPEAAAEQVISDAASVDLMLSAVVKSKPDTSSLKIYLIKALRLARFTGAEGAREHDARLAEVFRLWTGDGPGDARGLYLSKLVVETWVVQNGFGVFGGHDHES